MGQHCNGKRAECRDYSWSILGVVWQWHSFKLFVAISNDYMIFDKIDKICIRANPA